MVLTCMFTRQASGTLDSAASTAAAAKRTALPAQSNVQYELHQ